MAEITSLFRAHVSSNLVQRSDKLIFVEDQHVFRINQDLSGAEDVADVHKTKVLVSCVDTVWAVTEAGEIWDYIERGY